MAEGRGRMEGEGGRKGGWWEGGRGKEKGRVVGGREREGGRREGGRGKEKRRGEPLR